MDQIIDHKINIDGLSIYYKSSGDSSNPTLIFLHGYPMQFLGYQELNVDNVIKSLSKYFFVLAPEHPGLYRSDPPIKEPWNMKEYAILLDLLVEQLKIKNFILMGQSFGGGIAATYALMFPEKVKTLVLVDALTTNKIDVGLAKFKKIGMNFYRNIILSSFIPTILKKYFIQKVNCVPKEKLTKEFIKRYGKQISSNFNKVDVDYIKLKMPLLLVWADKDEITPIQVAQEIHKDVKGSKLIILKGTHTILYQYPEETVNEVIKHLK